MSAAQGESAETVVRVPATTGGALSDRTQEVREMETLTDTRERVASFRTYAEAEKAVDSLSDRGFPVDSLSIAAHDLRYVETVTGRRGYASAAFQSLVPGALVGAGFGFVLGAFSWIDPLVSGLALATYGFVIGALLGLVAGLVGHWISAGRRDFSSVGSVEAGTYDVLCDRDQADRAVAELAGSGRPS